MATYVLKPLRYNQFKSKINSFYLYMYIFIDIIVPTTKFTNKLETILSSHK